VDSSSFSSSLVHARSWFDPWRQVFLVGRGFTDHPLGDRGTSARARHELLVDRPRTRHGPSIFLGAVLEVLLAFSDHPPRPRGPSSAPTRIVRPTTADCPPGASQSA
jgi:hypothetical protein